MTRVVSSSALSDDPLWYKDAIIYQVHVRSFFDTNADGIGDFQGLMQKLDYIERLGVTAIWVLPFYPSPLRDDGYDIANYTNVLPMYGTLKEFMVFLTEAHRRGLRVITELVMNHTSDQHPWFQRARHAAAGSRERDFYVWSKTPEKYQGARVIFKDFETSNWAFDPIVHEYYWHRFYAHQPDLNYDSKDVQRAMFRILDTWLDRGVDGLRLDAIPYLFEREGTSCENLPETHAFLKLVRKHVDERFKNRMLLAEANQWPEDVVTYFGDGDECHMAFNFPIMPRLFMALRLENQFPIVDILDQTPPIPTNAQWAMFLRNHDELTLEMVTDKERDYMYQVFARDPSMRLNLGIRRRLAPLLKNDRRQIELLNVLLFSLPGAPILYYGDEIGMGDNVYLGDRNGVRTPMQWNADRNAGFSTASPQRLYLPVINDPEYNYEAVNVQNQENNRQSLLWWMRHLIHLRKQHQAFSRGSLMFLRTGNQRILACIRECESERILVLANLSPSSQYVELNLLENKGRVPRELFGRTQFPVISESPYTLSFSPYGYYWLLLEEKPEVEEVIPPLTLAVSGSWLDVLKGRSRPAMLDALQRFLVNSPWFQTPEKFIDHLFIVDDFRLFGSQEPVMLLIVQVEFYDGSLGRYAVYLTYVEGEEATRFEALYPKAVVARLQRPTGEVGLIVDATFVDRFYQDVGGFLAHRRVVRGQVGSLQFDMKRGAFEAGVPGQVSCVGRENNRFLAVFDERFLLRVYRGLDFGLSPGVECSRFLTDVQHFPFIRPLVGSVSYGDAGRERMTMAAVYGFVPSQSDMWEYTLSFLVSAFQRVGARMGEHGGLPEVPRSVFEVVGRDPPGFVWESFGVYMDQVKVLGQRTAALHRALGETRNPGFVPEVFSDFYKYSQYQSQYGLMREVVRLLVQCLPSLDERAQVLGREVVGSEREMLERFKWLRNRRVASLRIRVHGDLVLGKVLFTGKDFVFVDFEGEPGRSPSERRNKASPWRDVAALLRSLHYASYSAVARVPAGEMPAGVDVDGLRRLWYQWASALFLGSYLEGVRDAWFVSRDPGEVRAFLDAYLLERALVELRNELESRPERAHIPLEGIVQVVRFGKLEDQKS